MADFQNAFDVEVLSLDDKLGIIQGDLDPSSGAGETAPVGSLYLRTNGLSYQKFGPNDVDWVKYESSNSVVNILDDLTDTTIVAPKDSQTLIYDVASGQWKNVTIAVPPASSGRLVQIKFGPIPANSGTAIIPIGEAAPLITEGLELWSETITPTNILHRIRISTSLTFTATTSSMEIVWAVFRDNICIGASIDTNANKDSGNTVSFNYYDTPNVITPVTYSLRVGKDKGPGSWYINHHPNFATPLGGNLTSNAYTVEEIGGTT